jgi:hypothetical protein
VPHLVRADAVQVGALARLQQEVDRRRNAALAAEAPGQGGGGGGFRRTIGLAELAAFRMRGQSQSSNERGDVRWHDHGHFDLFSL